MKKKVMKMAQALLAVVTTLTVLLSGGISARAAVSVPDYYIGPAFDGDTGVDIKDMSTESYEYGISSGNFAANKWICVGEGLTASFSGGLSYAEDVFEGYEPCYKFTSDVRFEVSGTTVTFISARAAVDPDYYMSIFDSKLSIVDMNDSENNKSGISSGNFAANKWICVGEGLTASFSGGLSYAEDGFFENEAEKCYKFTTSVRFEVSGTTVTFIGTGEKEPDNTKVEPEHKHSFSWGVEREATEIYPGVKVNKCSECGYVSERVTLPVADKVMEKLNNSFETQLKSAQQGGTVTLELGDWNSLQNKFMKKIQDSKVDVTLKYNYKGKKYTVIIPANGFKDMGVEWYGPAFLYSIYGGTIED